MDRKYKRYLKGAMPGYASIIVGLRDDGLWVDLYMSNGDNCWKPVTTKQEVALDNSVIEHDKEVGWIYTEIDSLFVELL